MLYTVVHNMSSKVPFPVAERSQSRNLVSDLGLSTTAMAHCVPMCVCVALLLKTSKHLRQFRFHWPWFIEPDHDAPNENKNPRFQSGISFALPYHNEPMLARKRIPIGSYCHSNKPEYIKSDYQLDSQVIETF